MLTQVKECVNYFRLLIIIDIIYFYLIFSFMKVNKPQQNDLEDIRNILIQWTEQKEVDKYMQRIENEINGKTEFNMQFFVARDENEKAVGVAGLSDLLPKALEFSKTKNPGEVKILYVDNDTRGKGVGKKLIKFLEKKAKENSYSELLVRSARKYCQTAYGFYKHMGYEDVGEIKGGSGKIMKVFRKILE